MLHPRPFLTALSSAVMVVVFSVTVAAADSPDAEISFGRDILPILSDSCFHCHGPDEKKREADLRLDVREGALRTENPVIVPGKSGESELVRRIFSQDPDEMMPPPKSNRSLTAAERELLKRWVDQGAPWGKHWAYEPPQRPELPQVKNTAWLRNGIDYFVLARLEHEGLQPSPEAPPETLIRRVTLDLTGLPPTLAEVEHYLDASSPSLHPSVSPSLAKDRERERRGEGGNDAYDALIDKLLASPRYGERMAWDWLDAARYADSNGYQGDSDRTMWPWRDWVVRAFNANLPYDQFTVEQLAGDLLPEASREQRLATAFNRNHMINGEGGRIAEENRVEYVMDQIETLATIWLGTTLTCARCHDHKFDPITQREYYQLFAYFNQTPVDGNGRSGQAKPVIDFANAEQTRRRAQLLADYDATFQQVRQREQQLREASYTSSEEGPKSNLPPLIESALRKGPGDRAEQNREELLKYYTDKEKDYVALLGKLETARKARDQYEKTLPQVMVMEDMPKPRETFMLTRGAYDKPGDKVSMGVPASLPPLPADSSATRLALARWLVATNNPLMARVTVNRYWQAIFGTGLVKTVEDFGVQGERPVHAELLDWLAVEFVESGWDVKALHRLLVTSATYRQSSKATPRLIERDPENRLLARGARQRLPSWIIRDQALAIAGLLVEESGGPPVKPYQPEGIWEEATFGKISYKQDQGESLYRRSLYTFWRRIVGPTMFFDNASRQSCTVKAVRTNTPLHALTTLNDTTYVEAARALAQRVLEGEGTDTAGRLAVGFRLATARSPTEAERALLTDCYQRLKARFATEKDAAVRLLKVGLSPRNEALDPIEHAACTGVCMLILNLDEVLCKN